MTIRIYPSQIEGQPLETHSHKHVTIKKWLESNVKGFSIDRPQPIIVKVGGIEIPPEYWHMVKIKPNADVRIYPVPYGVEIGVIAMWVSLAVSVVSLIYSLTLDTSGPGSRDQGDKINTNTAKANAVKLYDPVPQILGRSIVYPQYIGQPVTRFVNRREMRTSMALCIGTGAYSIEPGSLKIGDTGFPAFGSDVSYNIYQPGQNVSADSRFDNWYVCGEVGGTDAGTAGLDLQSSSPSAPSVSATSVTLNAFTIYPEGPGAIIPEDFFIGMRLNIMMPNDFFVEKVGSYDVITGDFRELVPEVGMFVSLSTDMNNEYFEIATYTPPVSPSVQSSITLKDSSGNPFSSLPSGQNRMSIGLFGNIYEIRSLGPDSITVFRCDSSSNEDFTWNGFVSRSLMDFSIYAMDGLGFNWIGPFVSCPNGETTDLLEIDIYMPQGLVRYDGGGNPRAITRNVIIEWRDSDIGGPWNSITRTYSDSTPDAIGFTERIALPNSIRPEVRLRRLEMSSSTSYRDQILWYSLRSKIDPRPNSYDGVTTMGLTVRTGARLGAQSSRSINLIATRHYPEHDSRSIEGAVLTVTDSLGIPRSDVDTAQLEMLQDTFWTPRGETFDFIFDKQSTTRDVLRTIFGAGMGYPILSGGLISCGREGLQNPKGMLTPGEMTNNLEVSFQAPTADDFSGVDVEYMSGTSWTKEVVQCRLPGLTPLKIEKVTLDGVTDKDRAWRIGMRRLRKHVGQRLTFSCETEMDSWVYDYMNRIVLADDIPNTTMSASIIGITYSGTEAILDIDEPIDVNAANPRVMIRRNDGSVTPLYTPRIINEQLIAVPIAMIDFDIKTDLSIEYARILFGDSTRIGYDAIIESISPSGDYRNTLTSLQYSADYYADDDNSPSN